MLPPHIEQLVERSGEGVLVGPLLNLHNGEVVRVYVSSDTIVLGSADSKEGYYQTAIQLAIMSVGPFNEFYRNGELTS